MKSFFILVPVVLALTACDDKKSEDSSPWDKPGATTTAVKKTETEKCVDYIYHNSRIGGQIVTYGDGRTENRGAVLKIRDNDNWYVSGLEDSGEWYPIDQKTALKISSNWDFNNMKYYDPTDGIDEHELDACEVAGRMKEFFNHIKK